MTRKNPHPDDGYDVVVVGGGTAGLSAALILGRSRREVLVVDAGEPRNAPAAHMQGYLSRDGMSPAEFLETGRREVASYGVEIVHDRVVAAERAGEGFTVRLAGGGTARARQLVVTTGLVDALPDLPGFAEQWGKGVLHCPYCHGWEVRDQPVGVVASPTAKAHQAVLLTQWSDDVTFFLHTVEEAQIPAEDMERLAAAGVAVVRGEVAGLVTEDGKLTGVRMTDGRVVPRTAVFSVSGFTARDELLTSLGAETEETALGTFVKVDPAGRTSVPGVWAAGNAIGPAEQVVNAASGGYRAGAALNSELVLADLDRARARVRPGR